MAGANSTYNLSGGVLLAPKVVRVNGTGTFNFNGGTLQASSDTLTFMGGLTTANVQAGGAKIDSNGYNITIAQALLHGATTDGGLTKLGGGTLNLGGANLYTGETTVSAGTLTVSTSLNGTTGTALTFGNTGTFNAAEAAGRAQGMGALTFIAGDGTVQSTYGGSGNTSLTFSSLAARITGATGSFVVTNRTNGTTNQVKLTGKAAGFIDQGTFFGGSNYAWMNALSTYVRGISYITTTGGEGRTFGSSTTGIASTTHAEITGNVSGQANGTSFTTLNWWQ